MKTVIFLDFDGVLHDIDAGGVEWGEESWRLVSKPGYAPLFCHAEILWHLIKDLEVDLVVHSTWRRNHCLDEIRELFPEPMRECIVAVTDPTLSRFESIEFYIELECIERYLVVDDDAKSFPKDWEHLVLCDGSKGLSEAKTQERIRAVLQTSRAC